ncbi:hypothetical protein F511_27715 [Dorcoceras hygrometricum]|uniref:Uncharacterized protein n=1 Tax=Dorcoceras hygrometricum TaxID=472368 RepID=A0A2Z7BXG7_9LAMI|nr:hypothetical protein F511_27715 [Dorcoceras hygrometricum]
MWRFLRQCLQKRLNFRLKGLTELSEIPKDVVFDAKSIVSLSGEPVSTSGKNKAMKLEFRLLCDIMAKTISVKAGSFDSLTQEKFQMITAVTCGVKVNWSSVLFNILKNMVTPATRQAKGYAIQISLLLENVQNLELGESTEFPSSKIMTEKTVHRYIAVTDKVSGENVADVPKVKRTPVKKAVSKKRPAADDAEAAPVVKKKRTSKGKPVSSKDTLEIKAISQEAVPIQIVEATTAAPTEQPHAHKRKSQKRKRRLVMPQGSDDDVFEQPAAEGAGETAVESVPVETTVDVPVVESAVEEPVFESEVTEPAVDPVVVETVVEPFVETFPSDDVDNIIQQVLVETVQLGATETVVGALETQEAAVEQHWFDLPYEDIIAKLNDRQGVTPSDTDEEEPEDEEMSGDDEQSVAEMIDADEAMSLEDILYSIPVDVPLSSAGVEITKITLGKEIKIPGVDERTWYLASLPQIPVDDKGKEPLMQKDPIKGKPPHEHYSLICADIDLLVQLRAQVIDEVEKFFNSFSLNKLATLQIDESYFEKEALVLSWAEAESTRIALNRKVYILMKYREVLVRKFIESWKLNFKEALVLSWAEAESTRIALNRKVYILMKYREVLVRKFIESWKLNFVPGRPRDRGAVIARNNTNAPSKCWIRTMILVDGVWVVEPCCDQWVKIPRPVVHNEVPRQLSYVDTLPAPTVFALRLSQFCTIFIRYSLFSRLSTSDITDFVASIASTVLRSVQITSSSAVSQYIPSVADTEFFAQRIPMELDQRPFLSSISDAPDMHFDETDIADTMPSLPAITTDFSASLDDLHTFLSERINDIPRRIIDSVSYRIQIIDVISVHSSDSSSSSTYSSQNQVDSHVNSPMHEETSADQIDFLVDTAVDGETLVTQISLPAVDTSDVAESLSQLRASITRLSVNQLKNSSKIGDLRNHLLFKIENLEKAFKETLSNQEQISDVTDIRSQTKEIQAFKIDFTDFQQKTESGIAHVSSQLSEIIAYINRGGNDKKGEVSSSHGRGQPPPRDGGGSCSKSEPSRKRGSSGSKQRDWIYWING